MSQEKFDSFIACVADAISFFEYEIRSTQHQITKDKIYAFVNSVSDSVTQIATIKSPDELLYIRRLLDAMFEKNNSIRREVMAIRSMQALEKEIRKGNTEKGLTQSEAEKLLATLEREKWLEKSPGGFYSLAPRALMELRTWLVDTYNDSENPQIWQKIKFCKACKEIVTVGQRCSNFDCNVRLHNICEDAYWRSRPSRNCPECKLEWNGEKFVGEKAVTSIEQNLRRKSKGAKRSRLSNSEEDNESRQSQGDNSLLSQTRTRSHADDRESTQNSENDSSTGANTDEDVSF